MFNVRHLIFCSILLIAACYPVRQAAAQESAGDEMVMCIAQFPCHLKTGKLLPGFKAGTPCKWEKICKDYRGSADFKKLQRKSQRQKRQRARE